MRSPTSSTKVSNIIIKSSRIKNRSQIELPLSTVVVLCESLS